MKNYIKKVRVIGLHEKFDIEQIFYPGINVIYSENGEFKTTLLHILTNFLNKDFKRFFGIRFNKISIHFEDGNFYELTWIENQEVLELKSDGKRRGLILSRENQNLLTEAIAFPRVAYFPTFRSIVEAWFAYESKGVNNIQASVKEAKRDVSDFLRELFGDFVPNINFLSLPEIISSANERMFDSGVTAIQIDQYLTGEMASRIADIFISSGEINMSVTLGTHDTKHIFLEKDRLFSSIASLLEEINKMPVGSYLGLPKSIRKKINSINFKKGIGEEKYKIIMKLMEIYKDILEKELQEVNKLFSKFELYLDSLNSFLKDKKIIIKSRSSDYFDPALCLKYIDSTVDFDASFWESDNLLLEDEEETDRMFIEFKELSSGERQIVSLLYAAHISSQEIILIDEPEISLHTNWQETLLNELQIQTGDKQIIVCTHSPSIGADYIDEVQNMNISKTEGEEDTDDTEDNIQETNKEEAAAYSEYEEAEYYTQEYEEQQLRSSNFSEKVDDSAGN